MFALGVVVAAILVVLALVYGLGFLCFWWWDGGLLRRVLLAAQAGVMVYAMYVFAQGHRLPF